MASSRDIYHRRYVYLDVARARSCLLEKKGHRHRRVPHLRLFVTRCVEPIPRARFAEGCNANPHRTLAGISIVILYREPRSIFATFSSCWTNFRRCSPYLIFINPLLRGRCLCLCVDTIDCIIRRARATRASRLVGKIYASTR